MYIPNSEGLSKFYYFSGNRGKEDLYIRIDIYLKNICSGGTLSPGIPGYLHHHQRYYMNMSNEIVEFTKTKK